MRGRSLSIGTVGSVAGFVAVAAAIVATCIHFRHADVSTDIPAGSVAASARNGSLTDELARCRKIGIAAKDDAACKAAWATMRRRFFSYRSPSGPEASVPTVSPSSAAMED